MAALFKSVRAKVFAGFLAMSVIAVAIGAYAVHAISKAGAIVVDTYDRPLMAINFIRAANLDFSRIETQALHRRTERTPQMSWLDELASLLDDDLAVAEQRALSTRSQSLIKALRQDTGAWIASLRAAGSLDALGGGWEVTSDKIMTDFDTAIEILANESFLERQKAVNEVARSRKLASAAILSALVFALAIAYGLSRQILRPLGAAARAARRIAAGEFETPLPRGGQDETGALLQSMQIMQDSIATMMEREKAARQSAQTRLVEAIESSKEAMLLVDVEDHIVIANSQMADFFPGLADDLLARTPYSKLFAADGTPRDIEAGATSLNAGDEAGGDEIILPDGRWLRPNRSPTREGGSFMSWTDVTDIKQREERYRVAQKQAEAASAAKSNFLANMSHELRTPLNAIIGFSEIISGQIFGPIAQERYVNYAGDILSSGRHLLEIINSVLDIAKSDAGKLEIREEPVDLLSILHDCIVMVREQCGRAKLTFLHDIPTAPIMVYGDAAKLRQIALNLLSNAVKFTPAGGAVTLSAGDDPSGGVMLSVSDTGIGMKAEDIPIALAPFGQIDSKLARKYEGTGLGLPLTKAFAELHGGVLRIESALAKGTTVTVTFPRLEERMASRETLVTAA